MDISRGFTFVDGGSGNASNLHALVDASTILPGFITGKTTAVPGDIDSFIFAQGTGALRRVTLAGLVSAFPKGAAANVFALRKIGSGALDAAAGNDSRFPVRITGIRKANNTSPDTVANPQDLTFPSVQLAGATAIDWLAGDLFTDTLTTNKTYTFTNKHDGRMITVGLKLQGHLPTWPALIGAVPTITPGATIHYFTFIHSFLGTSGTVVAV